ncbi:hypothetical protein PGT21_027449 [Puccinia graminis f. sp. tritici]|uniref:Uncharacterized protein n=1 Tax=Puccinia graminis f. sp. tritici TaxID=56615 RepID=A0A5B0QNQ1_PUCGR|nr:hypothetical protein PGT21_027449 [Puccinia graminis f. sp. tritici]KAA1127109.1 hypothetical protein PGTUg99_022550 [Puccinia graminis f. sp. tritici]
MDPSNTSGEEKHWPQADLVVEKFKSLVKQLGVEPINNEDPHSSVIQDNLTINVVDAKKDLFRKLHSNLIPQLRRQMTDILPPLDPIHLIEDPSAQLEIILGIQSELERTLNQIQSTVATLCPRQLPYTCRNNDQHRKEIKSFRVEGLYNRIMEDLLPDVLWFCDGSGDLIRKMKLTSKKFTGHPDVTSIRKMILDQASLFFEAVDLTNVWLEGSEFDLVQYDWPKEIRGINEELERLLSLINGTAHLEQRNRMSGPLSDPAVQLSKSLLPIFKLSRLFLNKLSHRRLNRKRLPLFTEMRSDQLQILGDLAANVGLEFYEVLEVLKVVDRPGDFFARVNCTRIATKLEDEFESALFLIPIYFLPLFPDTEGFPIQNHFKAWFVTWYTQFSLAIQNFLEAAESFDDGAL